MHRIFGENDVVDELKGCQGVSVNLYGEGATVVHRDRGVLCPNVYRERGCLRDHRCGIEGTVREFDDLVMDRGDVICRKDSTSAATVKSNVVSDG